jgi:uroporphyrinogen-III synthase
MSGCAQGAARVLVTRPLRDAQPWVEQLRQQGFDGAALPLIEITPVTAEVEVAALQRAWQSLDDYAALMFVSGNAVEHFFKQKQAVAHGLRAQNAIKDIATTGLPAAVRFLAPGPGTAAALQAEGIAAAQIDAPPQDAPQFDSEALWHVIGRRGWAGRRVLVLRGQSRGAAGDAREVSGRDWLVRQWQAAGARVDVLGVYERGAPSLDAAQIVRAREASGDGTVWLFSSSEAVANLQGYRGLAGIDWSRARAVATHPRIAASVQAAGWGVVVESRPALQDILHTLRSIESGYS